MCAATVPCCLGLWGGVWNGFEQHRPELLGSFCSFHYLCGLQWQMAWKDHSPNNSLDLGEWGSRVTGWWHHAKRSSQLRWEGRVCALLLLADCWSRAECTFCSVSARSCVDVVFDPGCMTSGLVPLKTLVGIYTVIQDKRAKFPLCSLSSTAQTCCLPQWFSNWSADRLLPSTELKHLVYFM